MKRRALLVGVNRVDPAAPDYAGWDGKLEQPEADAIRFWKLLSDLGFYREDVWTLFTEGATEMNVASAVRKQLEDLTAGDLLVLYYSGHGGQRPDRSGDELDGKDETLCLFDRQLEDDKLPALVARGAAGVRILFVTDSCNAGTNFKGPAPSPATQATVRRRPYRVRADRLGGFRGELIHLGGCRDGYSSMETAAGGVFTNALIAAVRGHAAAGTGRSRGARAGWRRFWSWLRGREEGTSAQDAGAAYGYREWYEDARRIMGRDQVPVYAEHGAVSAAFRSGPVLR